MASIWYDGQLIDLDAVSTPNTAPPQPVNPAPVIRGRNRRVAAAPVRNANNVQPTRLERARVRIENARRLRQASRGETSFIRALAHVQVWYSSFTRLIRSAGALICVLLFIFGLVNDERSLFYRGLWTLSFMMFWWFIDLGFIGKPIRLCFTIICGGLWIAFILMLLR